MARTAEQKEFNSFGGKHGSGLAIRKFAANLHKSSRFKEFMQKYESNDYHHDNQPQQELPIANPNIIYQVNGERVIGSKFAEGILPANATPIKETTFFSRLMIKLRQYLPQKQT